MKLPLRIAVPLLLLLLAGIGLAEGPQRTLLLVCGMGVALWAAFSLPRPAPREDGAQDGEEAEATWAPPEQHGGEAEENGRGHRPPRRPS